MKQKILLLLYALLSVWAFYPKFFGDNIEEEVVCIPDTYVKNVEIWDKYAARLGVTAHDLKQKAFRESRLNPAAVKTLNGRWVATGLFQFTASSRKELGYDMPMCKYSIEEQLKAHDKYCRKWRWDPTLFPDDERGFRLYMIGFMPGYHKKPMDFVLIRGGRAYQGNRAIDTRFGNSDGNITIQEVFNFYNAEKYGKEI